MPRGSAWRRAVVLGCGSALGWLVGEVLRVRHRHVIVSLARAGIAQPSRVARAMYRNLGVGLVELLGSIASRGPDVEIGAGRAELAALLASGRGAIVATAHTGNWDSVACGLGRQLPLLVVSKRLSLRGIDWLWQRIRQRHGVALVHRGRVLDAVRGQLARGGLVAMMIDQAPDQRRAAVCRDFLGARAWVDLSPALLAARLQVPLVVAFPRRHADASHGLVWAGVLRPPAKAGRRWAIGAMAEATRQLEAFVRAHPEQWLWMHRRWKAVGTARAVRSEAPSVAPV